MALFDDEEAVADLALLKNHVSGLDIAVEHLLLDVLELRLRQVVEDEVVPQAVVDQVGVVHVLLPLHQWQLLRDARQHCVKLAFLLSGSAVTSRSESSYFDFGPSNIFVCNL